MSTQGCPEYLPTGPASQAGTNDMACSDIPAGDAKPANMITNATNSSLSHALPLESAEQTQSSVTSGRTPPSDDEQIVTTTNSSLTHAPQFGYADQSQSRLMNIPRELRDMIYGFVTARDAQLILGT